MKIISGGKKLPAGKIKLKLDFHVSREARKKYKINSSLYSLYGSLIISDFSKAREVASQINKKRKENGEENATVTAGEINALGLLHEIFHYLIRLYEDEINPKVFEKELKYLSSNMGDNNLEGLMNGFIGRFPSPEVYAGRMSAEDYKKGYSENKSNREIIVEELILLYLQNNNPAALRLKELFTDFELSQETEYLKMIDYSEKFFIEQTPIGPENLPLIQFLRMPIISSPHSIEGQLDYIIKKWGVYIYEKFGKRLLSGKDLIAEDLKLFMQDAGGVKPTPPVPFYDSDYLNKLKAKLTAGGKLTKDEEAYYYSEIEKFTADTDWMPKVVMIAKNIFVWLDQLSKKYGRHIKTLDQIPDEELNMLAEWNFNSLWLIGLWERSSASRKIKQLTGNPEAAASAYSLYDYVVAAELGGESAFENLKHRAAQRGIKLASDMVPNHTGIFSRWVIDKPDYYIYADRPPFPGYTFNGPNLSDDDRVQVRIEDKYYSREDAAVVFERKDSHTGSVKYIYHGNDGTHMPWNDTAQLNLLNPETRESLIQTIMHVARKTPIIRFDAAMTLSKKHYQRLWFPQPGTGGAIPSRSDYAMSIQEFNNVMKEEFWREVVDRINTELPDTLLLAEAFWLMEGYFVRTLGMHRVYNSAFMHMLMKEENNKFRQLIKNTLEFNPEILKRYVNFMSNPDEETAVNQFGKGDKYFGVAVMMVTLPGLPMFAHGQVEGYSEKYGMEYKRAYYNEFPDEHLVNRHKAEIFPLMRKRRLFSQVAHFELYDFIDNYGNINENVFAFTNRSGDEKTLVLYNNSYNETKGTINYSAGRIRGNGSDITGAKLAESLNIKHDPQYFYVFTEQKTNLKFIFSGAEINDDGMFFGLDGYEFKVFTEIREIFDSHGIYKSLKDTLAGGGTYSIEEATQMLRLKPLHDSLWKLSEDCVINQLNEYLNGSLDNKDNIAELEVELNLISSSLNSILYEINKTGNFNIDRIKAVKEFLTETATLKDISELIEKKTALKSCPKWLTSAADDLKILKVKNKHDISLLLYVFLFGSVNLQIGNGPDIFADLMLDGVLAEIIKHRKLGGGDPQNINLLQFLSSAKRMRLFGSDLFDVEKPVKGKKKQTAKKDVKSSSDSTLITKLLDDKEIGNYLNVNEYEGVIYYSKEKFENLIDWLFSMYNLYEAGKQEIKPVKKGPKKESAGNLPRKFDDKKFLAGLRSSHKYFIELKAASDKSGYKIDLLKDLISGKKV